MAPSALFNGYGRSSPMSQQHCHFDASRSLSALEQDSTIIAVIELSQSKWLVAGLLPGVERHPLKKRSVPGDVLWADWETWCKDNGHHAGSKTAFWAKLNAALPTVERARRGPRGAQRWHYLGIGFAGASQKEKREMAEVIDMVQRAHPTPSVAVL
jgi:hypothetical protein